MLLIQTTDIKLELPDCNKSPAQGHISMQTSQIILIQRRIRFFFCYQRRDRKYGFKVEHQTYEGLPFVLGSQSVTSGEEGIRICRVEPLQVSQVHAQPHL